MIAGYFLTTEVRITVESTAFSDGVHMHTFEGIRELMGEVFWVKMYADSSSIIH